MADEVQLAQWRSWLDKDLIPEGWDRNLWDEFYALFQRRALWRGYREILQASPNDAQDSARYLTRWVLRNHIETQALAIRRIANRTGDPRPVSLIRLLDEIAAEPHILSVDAKDAEADADALHGGAGKVSTFASKVVAHLDRDHADASRDLDLADMDDVVDQIGRIWEKWYVRVTGSFAPAMEPAGMPGWPFVLRFRRRDPSILNPEYLAARVAYEFGKSLASDVLDALTGSKQDRIAMIARLLVSEDTRWLAEILRDLEDDQEARLVEALRLQSRA